MTNHKPLTYLDQNVLSILKGKDEEPLKDFIKDKCQVVYSNETLKEIYRSEMSLGNQELGESFGAISYLKLLSDLDAVHIHPEFTLPEWKPTGRVVTNYDHPIDVYISYCGSNCQTETPIDSGLLVNRKLYGDKSELTWAEVEAEMLKGFSQLLESTVQQCIDEGCRGAPLDAFTSSIPSLIDMHKSITQKMIGNLQASDEYLTNLAAQIRSKTDIDTVHLNNISSPNVVKKIWDAIKESELVQKSGLNIDALFNPLAQLNEPALSFKFQQVNGVYMNLHLLGYWPDEKVEASRYHAHASDMSHGTMASFADILISRDKKFLNKISATYEYLEINTKTINANDLIKTHESSAFEAEKLLFPPD
ncbi:MAG: hypothetical protein L0G80_13935 [Shewanella sp.]|nr:hypothetical protein [Shewanella sp.]MDN5501017.1 hypothetical protein [Shewanella sp.]MDN5529044.1 hypothetical protein [Shewanella sp.]